MPLKFKNPPINEKETAGIHTRIRQRIEILKEIGEKEEIAYNPNSEHDLWRFLKRLSFIKSPKLFLLDNGNLRAVWKGDGGKHIGLQFLGGEQIQFVIFSRRGEHNNMARIRGRDDEVEDELSVNWIEAFASLDKDRQISEIRRLFRLTVKKNGRFAELPVGAAIEAVLDEIDGLSIEEDPLDSDEKNGHEADPSHALIRGTPDPTTDSELAETVGDMIADCVTELHPATTEQVAMN